MGIKSKLTKVKLTARYIRIRMAASADHGDKIKTGVLIDLSGLNVNRRSEQVVLQLRNAGFSVSYKMTLKHYLRTFADGLSDNQKSFFRNVRYYDPKRDYSVVFCHKKYAEQYKKRIVFNDDILSFAGAYNSDFYYPIMFHPLKLARNNETELLNAGKDYHIGFVFVGNNSDLYVKYTDTLHNKYHVETRTEIINYLLKNFSDYIVRPENEKVFLAELYENKLDLRNKILIVDKFRLSKTDYWEVFRMSAYHIWTAGYIQPYCHNHIEGICSGVIPIYNGVIKYPGLNDSNSYSYSDHDGFGKIVKTLLATEVCSDDAAEKSRRVREVYANHFSNEVFAEKLNRFINSDENEKTFYVCEGITGE